MCNFEAHHSKLSASCHEDMDIDDQHYHQGHQHAAKEIEIDHIVKGNHSLKQAMSHSFRAALAFGGSGSGVPTCVKKTVIYCQFHPEAKL